MEPIIDLKGKAIVITGASSGLGRQCAITASRLGAHVVLLGRDRERLQETRRQMDGDHHLDFSLDLKAYDQIESVIQAAVEKTGPIAGFIHSAGLELTLPLKSMQAKNYEELFAVNVFAGFELAKTLSKKKYLPEGGAAYVFIASVMAMLGQAGKVAYCASKSALLAGVKAMALELAPRNIRVNCISPAVVETEMAKKLFASIPGESHKAILDAHPLGLGQPEDVANACMFLLSPASRWITGTNMVIDGGYSAR
jgi:NAD(P)-dependent dehydrogenase (short-subunit alcohol dehydrogenase family)